MISPVPRQQLFVANKGHWSHCNSKQNLGNLGKSESLNLESWHVSILFTSHLTGSLVLSVSEVQRSLHSVLFTGRLKTNKFHTKRLEMNFSNLEFLGLSNNFHWGSSWHVLHTSRRCGFGYGVKSGNAIVKPPGKPCETPKSAGGTAMSTGAVHPRRPSHRSTVWKLRISKHLKTPQNVAMSRMLVPGGE